MSVRHTRTTVSCYAYTSRAPEKIDLSAAMVGYRTRKACTQTGQATFDLKGLRNWQNVLAENDLLAFYVDTGEGFGPEWVLWGYVDAVINPATIAQDRRGAPVLGTYTLQCSDFQKALDARVYQNVALIGRGADVAIDQDFASVGALGTGIAMNILGSPADVLDSLLVTTLGFGQQRLVPRSVPEDVRERQQRNDMLRRAILRMPVGVLTVYPRLNPADVELPDFEQRVTDALADARAKVKANSGQDAEGNAEALALLSVIARRTARTAPRTMVDMMSFDFVERNCIDGYTVLPPMLPSQGTINVSLNQLVRENVNGIVNELIFDLRPVANGFYQSPSSVTVDDRLGDGNYMRLPDVLGGNVADAQGTRYVPAVMLREYPFSTVPSVDLRGFTVGTTPVVRKFIANAGVDTRSLSGGVDLGEVPFGPIFDKSAVAPARVYYEYGAPLSNLSVAQDGKPPAKHLDISAVHLDEILNDTIARAGSGSANIVAVVDNSYGGALLGTWVGDLLPIVTPVAIQRDGVCVQELRTKFLSAAEPPSTTLLNTLIGSATGLRAETSSSGSIAARAGRWGLLWDHWHQHDYEYLSGSIVLKRQRPDIRVGYRLDVVEWHESYYVEAVEHTGQLVDGVWHGQTIVEVSRGQRNDPTLWYVPPSLSKKVTEKFAWTGNALIRAGGGNRGQTGRLSEFFFRLDNPGVLSPSEYGQTINAVDAPYFGAAPLRGSQPPLQYIPQDGPGRLLNPDQLI